MRIIIVLIVAVTVAVIGCKKLDEPVNPSESLPILKTYDDEKTMNEIVKMISDHEVRLSKSIKDPGITKYNDIVVPDDFITIQDAVDAAEPYAKIRVKAGTYSEKIVVMTEGLHIEAIGSVYIKGMFVISDKNVTINGFNISAPYMRPGIVFSLTKGGIAKNNIVTNGGTGINCSRSNNCTIENNTLYNNYWGLVIVSGDINILINNKVYENYYSGIVLQPFGNSNDVAEYNKIWGNETYSNGYADVGIYLYFSNNNLVKVNRSYSNMYGIYLYNSMYNNIEENNANNNGDYDMVIHYSLNNYLRNNNIKTFLEI